MRRLKESNRNNNDDDNNMDKNRNDDPPETTTRGTTHNANVIGIQSLVVFDHVLIIQKYQC